MLKGCIYFLKQHLKLTDDCLVDGFFLKNPKKNLQVSEKGCRRVYNGRPWDAIPGFSHLRAGGLKPTHGIHKRRRGRGSIADIFFSVSI